MQKQDASNLENVGQMTLDLCLEDVAEVIGMYVSERCSRYDRYVPGTSWRVCARNKLESLCLEQVGERVPGKSWRACARNKLESVCQQSVGEWSGLSSLTAFLPIGPIF